MHSSSAVSNTTAIALQLTVSSSAGMPALLLYLVSSSALVVALDPALLLCIFQALLLGFSLVVYVNRLVRKNDIINNRDATGRIAKWAIELPPFDITYKPWQAIKSQVLADFVAE